jgi:glycosyltransferase involved in cell wall biosynthesis
MRVLSVAFAEIPVGTPQSGGAEQILSILDDGLVERSHRSIVIGRGGSRVRGDLVVAEAISAQPYRDAIQRSIARYSVDLIHFHGLDFHRYIPACDIPMLATLHLPIDHYPREIFERRGVVLNCVSQSQAASSPQSIGLPVVSNGVSTAFSGSAEAGDYLLWLGRICPEKGTHIALEVAHLLGMPLKIAGPVHPYPAHLKYFADRVEPLLDGKRCYLGPAGSEEKRALLCRARCVLIPSTVAETSSLVAMEAMICGTPVVALRCGALPEIVEHAITGFIVDSPGQMADAVLESGSLSRKSIRRRAAARFDASRMIEEYLALYRSILTRRFGETVAPQENL